MATNALTKIARNGGAGLLAPTNIDPPMLEVGVEIPDTTQSNAWNVPIEVAHIQSQTLEISHLWNLNWKGNKKAQALCLGLKILSFFNLT